MEVPWLDISYLPTRVSWQVCTLAWAPRLWYIHKYIVSRMDGMYFVCR